jgi:hypothetical protein
MGSAEGSVTEGSTEGSVHMCTSGGGVRRNERLTPYDLTYDLPLRERRTEGIDRWSFWTQALVRGSHQFEEGGRAERAQRIC